jgi:hypothetical protein
MIVDGLYEGEDFDVAKKIKRARNAVLRNLLLSDATAYRIREALKEMDSHRAELQKTIDHLTDIEVHFRDLCIYKKVAEKKKY